MKVRKLTKANDLAGRTFGRLLALCRVESSAHGHAQWSVLCDCGTEKIVFATSLLTGKTVSCGCFQQESRTRHGGHGGKTYEAWQNMWNRVRNNTHYKSRGIGACDRWRAFEKFREDMGEVPAGLTLERTDNDADYGPGNCIWATRAEQSANTSRTHHVELDGKSMCSAEACRRIGLPDATARKRMRRGLTAQEALHG